MLILYIIKKLQIWIALYCLLWLQSSKPLWTKHIFLLIVWIPFYCLYENCIIIGLYSDNYRDKNIVNIVKEITRYKKGICRIEFSSLCWNLLWCYNESSFCSSVQITSQQSFCICFVQFLTVFLHISFNASLTCSWWLQTNVNWTNVHSINLTLVNVSGEDNGSNVTCIAENVVGMTKTTVSLTIYCKLEL